MTLPSQEYREDSSRHSDLIKSPWTPSFMIDTVYDVLLNLMRLLKRGIEGVGRHATGHSRKGMMSIVLLGWLKSLPFGGVKLIKNFYEFNQNQKLSIFM